MAVVSQREHERVMAKHSMKTILEGSLRAQEGEKSTPYYYMHTKGDSP